MPSLFARHDLGMEREVLERHLAAGLSLERIGELEGKHPSTIGYWVKKHGLVAACAAKYSSRGGIAEEVLSRLVARGLTVCEIAEALDFSATTVRYWLKVYGLKTERALWRSTSGPRPGSIERTCRKHGRTRYVLSGDGSVYRCARCRSERVMAWRRRIKLTLVAEAGGSCRICGYNRCAGALHFHHVDPSTKKFALSRGGVTRSVAAARQEAEKCVLLCSNCHAEVEAGMISATLRRLPKIVA